MRQLLCLLSFLLPLGEVNSTPLSMPQLVQQLQRQHDLDYLLIMGKSSDSWKQLLKDLTLPIILLTDKSNISYNLNRYHSSNLLSIIFVEQPAESLVEYLALNIKTWNMQPLLLILRKPMRMEEIFEYCWQQKQLLNVLAIYEDFEETGLIFGYTPFPIMQFEERRIDDETKEILPNRLNNLNGYRIPTMIGGSTPRLIVYRDANGELVYKGFVGHLRHCFELKYNCQLVQTMEMNESTVVPAEQLVEIVASGKITFALGVTFTEPPINRFTYPIELVNWCVMLPVPSLVPPSELYSRVLDLDTCLVLLVSLIMISFLLSLSLWSHGYPVQTHEFVFHNNCLRGALGQSFNEVSRAPILVRGIYMEICTLGFLLTAWYNSYFSAYITSAPRVPPFSSFEHILNSNFKIVIWTPEHKKILEYKPELKLYGAIFKNEPNFERFLKLRNSFNTNFGFMMPLDKWFIVQQQQKVFRSPLVTFRDDLCVFRGIPVGFPIAANSVFREPLERLIGEATASGLMIHWRDMAFSEMITARKLTLADLGQRNEFRAMQLIDLNYVLMATASMMILAFLVFLIEHIIYWLKKVGRHLSLA